MVGICFQIEAWKGFPGVSDSKESTCIAGDLGSIPGLGRSPRGGHGNPLQYSYLENPMDRRAWCPTVHGVTKSWTPLSNSAPTQMLGKLSDSETEWRGKVFLMPSPDPPNEIIRKMWSAFLWL